MNGDNNNSCFSTSERLMASSVYILYQHKDQDKDGGQFFLLT